MKNIYLILLLFSICFLEDRAYIFNTGAPESLDEGYTISPTQSVADTWYENQKVSASNYDYYNRN